MTRVRLPVPTALAAVPPARIRDALAGALAVLALGVAGCGPAPQAQPANGPPAAPPPMPVHVHTARLQSVPVLIEAVGRAEGSKEVEVRARVGGLIESQFYREGERVKAGAPLFGIERAPFEIALAQAEAALAQQQARTEQARREARRLRPLAEQKAVSQREYDDAVSGAQLAEAAVLAAQAQVREARLNLSYTAVHAPIAGITGRAEKSQGSLVSPGADSLLTHVTQADPIWVRFSFSESEQAQLQSGASSKVRLLGGDGKPLPMEGTLNFTGSTVDPRLGTVQMRAEFANAELAVLPGQFVRAQVQVREEQGFLVPQAAVMSSEQGRNVWTVKDGKATPTPVEVGAWVGHDWVVRKGLAEGDQVIVDNLMKLRPGAPVAVQANAAPQADAASRPSGPSRPDGPAQLPGGASRPGATSQPGTASQPGASQPSGETSQPAARRQPGVAASSSGAVNGSASPASARTGPAGNASR